MSVEKNKAIIRKANEALNKKNLAIVDEFIAPDFVDRTLQIRGLESFKKLLTIILKGFPDFHLTIEEIIAEGDKVWVHYTETMTHTGEYRGIAPTGKKITFPSVWMHRIVDGKIVEREGVTNDLNLLKQLGVIEYKGFPDEVK